MRNQFLPFLLGIFQKAIDSISAVVYSMAIIPKEDTEMTIKEFINKAMDVAQVLLKRGDHEGYQKIMMMIADEIYKAQVQF